MLGQVNGEYANREYVVPMATHEGALLASYSRGAKARKCDDLAWMDGVTIDETL